MKLLIELWELLDILKDVQVADDMTNFEFQLHFPYVCILKVFLMNSRAAASSIKRCTKLLSSAYRLLSSAQIVEFWNDFHSQIESLAPTRDPNQY